MKKTLLSLSLIFTLNQNAMAMIVEDPVLIGNQLADNIKSYAQMMQDYAQQVLMYKQMLVDTLNFEKHLEALGINMSEWQEIIGEISDTINGIENLINDLESIPDDFKKQLERTAKACSFLNSNVDGFSGAISGVTSVKRQTNKCFQALQNNDIIKEKLNSLQKDLQAATSLDEINSIKNEMMNIQNAEAFVKQEKNQELTSKVLAAYDTFYGENEDNTKTLKITSQEERLKAFEKITKQMKEAKNQKQVQAITNSILLQMLQQQTEMQGIMVNYSAALATQQGAMKNNNQLAENSFENEAPTYEFSSDLYQGVKKMETDENGLPIFRIN